MKMLPHSSCVFILYLQQVDSRKLQQQAENVTDKNQTVPTGDI
jgi:hypothetical protein